MDYSSQPTTRIRQLGSGEQFWWLIDQNHPTHFAVAAEIEGATTIEAWRAALDSVQRRHPNFSVNIERDKDANLYFYHVAGVRIPLRIVASDDLRWEPEMVREVATRFDTQQAPLVRAVLLHQAHRAVFILVSHHSIADAKSIVFAIRDILQALSGKTLVPLAPRAALDTLLPPVPEPGKDDSPPEDSAPAPRAKPVAFRKPDGSRPRLSRLTLTPALTRELQRRSRSEGTTIHGVLVAAAVAAARQASAELKEAIIGVVSPIDLRQLLEAGEDVAPLNGGTVISVEPKTSATLWETARFVKQGIVPPRTLETLARDFAPFQQFIATRPDVEETAAFVVRQPGHMISLNNLGAVPFETRFGSLMLEALWGPSILMGYEGEQLISVATVNGSLNMLHTSYEPLPLLLETMEKMLTAACA